MLAVKSQAQLAAAQPQDLRSSQENARRQIKQMRDTSEQALRGAVPGGLLDSKVVGRLYSAVQSNSVQEICSTVESILDTQNLQLNSESESGGAGLSKLRGTLLAAALEQQRAQGAFDVPGLEQALDTWLVEEYANELQNSHNSLQKIGHFIHQNSGGGLTCFEIKFGLYCLLVPVLRMWGALSELPADKAATLGWGKPS